MKNKILMITGILGLALSASAHAEFTFSCGKDRDKGAAKAEIGLVDSMESTMKLYVDGAEVAGDKLGIGNLPDGSFMVSIDRGAGKGSRKFVFSEKEKHVQEFSVPDGEGAEKKVGSAKPCDFKRVNPDAS